jgi:hypothetical protein
LDYNALISSLYDSFGVPYKEKVIIPMTDEDKARHMATTQQAAMQGKLGVVQAQGEVKKSVDNNQAENRMLIETGKHTLNTHGADHQASIDAAQTKAEAATPQAQGMDRAAKGSFASMDKAIFPK